MHRFSPRHFPGRLAGRTAHVLRLAAVVAACLATEAAHAVTIDWVTVGNPGNANDLATGNQFGAVGYVYQIGKYDVTIQQYTDFLNAAAKSDPYSLYNTSMASDLNIVGISRSGSSGGYTYSVIGSSGNKPITYVSWFDAARFANWMQNGQGSGSTETGAYTLGGATSGNAVAKNAGSTFYIPTENEWYKAAYYSPVKGGPASPGYYTYATQSDTAPGNTIGDGANQANYNSAPDYKFSVTQSSSYSSSQNYLTDVGAFTNSASFYGTFDQSGNVYQWNDPDGAPGYYRVLRGAGWSNNATHLSSSNSPWMDPSLHSSSIGFRLASPVPVPEPSTYALALTGLACGGWLHCRRRRKSRA